MKDLTNQVSLFYSYFTHYIKMIFVSLTIRKPNISTDLPHPFPAPHFNTLFERFQSHILILYVSPKMKIWLQRHPIKSFSVQTFKIHFVNTLSAKCSCFTRLFWLLHIVHRTSSIVLLKRMFKTAPGCCTYVMSNNGQPHVPNYFNIACFVCC
jgi:hypothetical protein